MMTDIGNSSFTYVGQWFPVTNPATGTSEYIDFQPKALWFQSDGSGIAVIATPYRFPCEWVWEFTYVADSANNLTVNWTAGYAIGQNCQELKPRSSGNVMTPVIAGAVKNIKSAVWDSYRLKPVVSLYFFVLVGCSNSFPKSVRGSISPL